MKKMKGFRKLLALVLALMMVFSAVSALAEEEEPAEGKDPEVVDGSGTQETPGNTDNSENPETPGNPENQGKPENPENPETPEKRTVLRNGSGSTDTIGMIRVDFDNNEASLNQAWYHENDENTVKIDNNADPASVEIKKPINSGNDGLQIRNGDNSNSTKNLTVNATDITADGTGLCIYDHSDNDLTVSTGNIESKEAEAIFIVGNGGGTKTVTVNGDVTGNQDGIKIKTSFVGTNRTLTVNGDVTGGKNGIEADNTDGKLHVIAQDVFASGTDDVSGIAVNQSNDNSKDITIEVDSVTATTTGDKKDVYGLDVKNGTVTIGGDSDASGKITVTGENGNAHGVKVRDGTIVVHGDGDTAISTTVVSEEHHVNSDVYGIEALGESDVTVAGGVYVKAKAETAIGVDVSRNSSVTISKGNIIVDNESSDTYTGGLAIITYEADEKATANVNEGSVISKAGSDGGYGILASSDEGGVVSVAVAKDVIAVNGIGLELFGDGKGKKDILIEGILSGDTAIMLDNEDSAKDTSLTVWKVESTGSNGIAAWGGNHDETSDATEVISGAINYIVKLAEGLSNDQIVTDKGKTVTINKDTENEKNYHTAKENETVTLTLTDEQLADYNPEKNELEVLYNADDATSKMALGTSASNGVFTFVNKVITLVMQSGGGMKLGFSFKAKTPEVQPEENQPEVKPDEKPEEKPEVKPEDKPKEEKVESKQNTKTDEPKQEATQTVADTASTIATTGTATVYNLLKIKDKSGKAELAFRNVGKYEIKSPDGNDEGSFGMEDGKIVLTSQTGKKMNIGQDGKLEYVIGNQTYEFKFGEADLEKLAAVKK